MKTHSKKICLFDNCKWPPFSHGYCKAHQWARTDAKKPKALKRLSAKGKLKKKEKAEYTLMQFEAFQKFYDNHPTKRCFECDAYIPVCMSYSVHHCLEKANYDDIRLDPFYWVLVCFSCHNKANNCLDFVPKIKGHTIMLLKIYAQRIKVALLILFCRFEN